MGAVGGRHADIALTPEARRCQAMRQDDGVTELDVERVEAEASRFRRALELGGLGRPSLEQFPRGSCGDASELLGQFFSDVGLGGWFYRWGFDNAQLSHGWIERDGLIVDITADQFAEISEPVLVRTDRSWHRRFRAGTTSRRVAALDYYGADHRPATEAIYEILRIRIEANELRGEDGPMGLLKPGPGEI